ncbi:MAG TPA: class I SAM-dependent methyltransferase [Steroidobacteraceae bacterium]|jgi:SAM-dependent methyltransferase|nr:class I SAM-dependent methyltransferase [Steroidobacteraceae bacterium]
MMARPVDLFYNTYANFTDRVLASVRAATYGEDIGQNSWVTVDEYDRFLEWLRLTRDSHALEVASGSGGPALYLAGRSGCRVTGVDVNPRGVATATQAAGRHEAGRRAMFKVADANDPLPFADGKFDALLCIDSMNHFPKRRETLRDWCRVLKPGGRAVFTDPVVITGPVTNEELAQRSSIGLFVFTPRTLNEELIADAGLRLLARHDVTENAAVVSRRWREAREQFRDELLQMEGGERYEGVQKFLAAVHRLTHERRLSRIVYLVEKDGAKP